ncbi:MAG: hypothetical protein SGCHY_003459 [Lobulomycetales sp.]
MTTVKPLDLILFVGDDFISKTIGDLSKGERDKLAHVHPKTPLWSHAGVVVDTTVFPHLEGKHMTKGKLYIYESIFSGSILNFTYSEVLPVDNVKAARRGRCAGPQIRDLLDVAKECPGNIAIAPLGEDKRAAAMQKLDEGHMRTFHEHYIHYSYPFSTLPQFAAANDSFFDSMNKIKERIREQAQKLVDSDSDGSSDEEDEGEGKPGSAGSKRSSKRSSGLFGSMRDLSKKVTTSVLKKLSKEDASPDGSEENVSTDKSGKPRKKKKRGAVFCSELAALFYKNLGFEYFNEPGRFTPVEVEGAQEYFTGTFWIKRKGELLLVGDKVETVEPAFIETKD